MESILNTSYLSKNGYVIKKENLSYEDLKILKNDLVGRPLVDEKYNFGPPFINKFLLYTETKTKIYIPKIYGIKKYGIPTKKLDNYIGQKWESNLEFKGELYPEQKEASDILLKELYNSGGGILSIMTGGGKTFTSLYVLSKLCGKALIIVNKITLLNQWKNEIKTCLPGCNIGIIQGKKIETEGKDIVLGMLQSLALIDYPDNTFKDINTLIIDECFPYDTQIITLEGNISIGELYNMKEENIKLPLVLTFNEIEKRFEYKKIINVFRKQNDTLTAIYCSKMKIVSTENHKYLTYNGWKEAKNLTINDYIRCYYDKDTLNHFGNYETNNPSNYLGYSKITKIDKNIPNYCPSNYVYDLEVEDNHNYIVGVSGRFSKNGFVVHNCHNVPSKVFSKVLMKTSSEYTIGLSATPKRGDGCEYIFKYFLGDVVYQSKSDRIGLTPKINFIKIKSKDYKEITIENKFTGASQIQFTSMISELINMPKRNALIIEIIKHHVLENRKILVLSDRREHLKNINTLLDKDPFVFFTYGLFVGQMKLADLEKSKASSVILATYAAFSEGVSEKDLDTLLLITPKKYIGHLKNTTKNESGKLEQIVGRIFRKDHIITHPLIIDLQDSFSIYKTQSNSRKIFYNDHFKNHITIEQAIDLDNYNTIKYEYIITKESKKNDINLECIIDD